MVCEFWRLFLNGLGKFPSLCKNLTFKYIVTAESKRALKDKQWPQNANDYVNIHKGHGR